MVPKKDWREIIIEEIQNYFLSGNDFLSFLRNKKLPQQLDPWSNVDISINLKFDLQAIDRWKHKRDSDISNNTIDIPAILWDFIDYIEEFLLKGKYAIKPDYIRLNQESKSDYLIWNYDNIETIDCHNERELYEKLLSLKNVFMYRDNLMLICNPLIFRKEGQKHMKKLLKIKELIPIKDKMLICFLSYKDIIPKYEKYYLPILFFEEPLKVYVEYDGGTMNNYYGFYVSWSGALKIKDKEAIKCIKIN
ncbi:hypothetical protein ES705_17831 [subsurface metagenome]